MPSTETVSLPPHVRAAAVRSNSFNADSNTIDICFTTGADVLRSDWVDGNYIERLECAPENVRLDRLNAGAAFLDTHNSWELDAVIGAVVPGSARMENGLGLCTIKLSKSARAADTVTDLRDGVINNISVGYDIHAFTRTEASEGVPAVMVATDWEPLEISAVPVPADPGAQVRAAVRTAAGVRMTPCKITRAQPAPNPEAAMADEPKPASGNDSTKTAPVTQPAAEKTTEQLAAEKAGLNQEEVLKTVPLAPGTAVVTAKGHEIVDPGDALPVNVQRAVEKAVAGERERINEIRATGRRHGLDKLANDHAERGTSVERFKDAVLEELAARYAANPIASGVREEPSLTKPKEADDALAAKARSLGFGKK